jgi:cytochrome d ubiquinol oxidase subunit I
MDVLEIARWQFGITTVFHFLFVPLTIGLSAIVAIFETAWVRTRNEEWLRLTKFFGKLFLINFALGVVTGIVQEFQFGMNWSDYSRFVGDVFGAPLAVEGLLAFFLESTFLGLWIFGWDRLPAWLHASTIWLVHIGTLFSAYFILAANSWMQHPVGYQYNAATGRAEMSDFQAVMFNKVQLVTFPHVTISAYLTGAAFVVAVAMWHLVRNGDGPDVPLYRKALRFGAVAVLLSGIGVVISGDAQAKVMTEVQPMKMAAAEGLYGTRAAAPFSVLTIGSLDGSREIYSLTVPKLLSYLATGDTSSEVQGIDDLRAQYRKTYGVDPGQKYYSPGDYTPIIPVTYWAFRLMIGFGFLAIAAALAMLWVTRRSRLLPAGRAWVAMAVVLPLLPLLANSTGWIFTEMGRQPWSVFGLMTTAQAVSPGVSGGEALTSLVLLTAVYAVLAVIELSLLLRYIKAGADPVPPPRDRTTDDQPLSFAY